MTNQQTRQDFLKSLVASAAALAAARGWSAASPGDKYKELQAAIDQVTPDDYRLYQKKGVKGLSTPAQKLVFGWLDAAFDKVLKEVRETVVTGPKPAVWLVYNMGVVVKTKEACFTIDLRHQKAPQIAPFVDFALITHRHGDHYTNPYVKAIDGAGKVVISNFLPNAGVKDPEARGLVRAPKVFNLKGVEIRASFTDHNAKLIDFTSPYEIRIGDFVIYHTGDCCNVQKLNPTRRPDLWIVHPYCGMKVADGVKRFKPVRTVVAHINELGHAKGHARWTWNNAFKAKADVEAAGGEAVVPIWGDRIQ